MADQISTPIPTPTLEPEQLYEINDWLTGFLGIHADWEAVTDEDDDDLNDLTHDIGELIAQHVAKHKSA